MGMRQSHTRAQLMPRAGAGNICVLLPKEGSFIVYVFVLSQLASALGRRLLAKPDAAMYGHLIHPVHLCVCALIVVSEGMCSLSCYNP
jgi:hypothetical protein